LPQLASDKIGDVYEGRGVLSGASKRET